MASALKRIKRELQDIDGNTGLIEQLGPDPDSLDPFRWLCKMKGPAGTPYEGGVFKLDIRLPEEYPTTPPQIEFITPIYHPNITTTMSSVGARICLEILDPKADVWRSHYTIQKIVLSIASLLAEPNPSDPLCPDIGKEMLRDKKRFESKAKNYTHQYAK